MKALVVIAALLFASPAFAVDLGFAQAAAKYGNSYAGFAELLKAISWVESRHQVDAVRKNTWKKKDGTTRISYDRGHMQINDFFWKNVLDEIDPNLWSEMLIRPALCTKIGAWILTTCIQKYGYTWDAVAAYHTGRSIDLADCNGDQSRVDRGYQYAMRVCNYLASNGHLNNMGTLAQAPARPSKATALALAGARREGFQGSTNETQILNLSKLRSCGTWRLVTYE